LKTSDEGIALVKRFEGCKLTTYRCSANILTIGYGCTRDVCEGLTITEAEAERRLRTDLGIAEGTVKQLVTYPITQLQFDALVSFTYNVGGGALKKSTLLKRINAGEVLPAAEEFLRWDKVNGQAVRGLTERRKAERALFLRGMHT